jgi:transposase
VRKVSLWGSLLGVEKTVVERVELDEEAGLLVAHVRPTARTRGRCGVCRRRCPGYDGGGGRRRWRSLDAGTVQVWLEAAAPRVRCPGHGVVVAHVPWARHGAGHTLGFDDQVAWLSVRSSKSTVVGLMRIAWRTVGSIVTRVSDDAVAATDRFAGLVRIGIDEISYKKGHRYLTVVVDHDSGRLVWAAPGRDRATLRGFFDLLGDERSAQVTQVSADAADWIAAVVADRCPNAVLCADPFHVVGWASDALDTVRKQAWNDARAAADKTRAGVSQRRGRNALVPMRTIKNTRYALWKNPENLTDQQQAKLAWIAKTDPRLYRAYLLKEGLRHVFVVKGEAGKQALDRWTSWARRCRIAAFVDLAKRIAKHRDTIDATLDHGLSNGLVESMNTKIRLLTRMAFGFKNPQALIALAMLALGGYCPPLPGRTPNDPHIQQESHNLTAQHQEHDGSTARR